MLFSVRGHLSHSAGSGFLLKTPHTFSSIVCSGRTFAHNSSINGSNAAGVRASIRKVRADFWCLKLPALHIPLLTSVGLQAVNVYGRGLEPQVRGGFICSEIQKIPIQLFQKYENLLQLLLNFTKEALENYFSFIRAWKTFLSLCKSAECKNLGNVQLEILWNTWLN